MTTIDRARVFAEQAARTFLLAVLGMVIGCARAADVAETPHGAPRGGHLVLIGGGSKPPDAMRLFVHLAGGPAARIVVLPLASGESREAGEDYETSFHALGAGLVRTVHVDDRRDALREPYVEAVRTATGVFFSGGDQSRIASRLLDTPMLIALREMKARGGVVGGTSAGTACQSEVMLIGAGNERVLVEHNIAVTRGIGLVDFAIMDTHFVARGRQMRLTSAVLEHPSLLGIGVDEGTAAWLRPDGTMQVLGASSVLVYDATHATHETGALGEGGALDARGLREHTLVAGQVFDLEKREVVLP